MVSQRQTTKLQQGEQLDLLPVSTRSVRPVDHTYLLSLPTLRRAVRYSISLADLEPKEVYGPLEMDKAIWSRIENGGMDFPASKLQQLATITQNEAPLLWLNNACGWDIATMRKLMDDKDRRLAAVEAENAELRAELSTITKFVRETKR